MPSLSESRSRLLVIPSPSLSNDAARNSILSSRKSFPPGEFPVDARSTCSCPDAGASKTNENFVQMTPLVAPSPPSFVIPELPLGSPPVFITSVIEPPGCPICTPIELGSPNVSEFAAQNEY